MADQPYWAGRAADLGIGAAHDGPTPTTESFSAALRTALTPRPTHERTPWPARSAPTERRWPPSCCSMGAAEVVRGAPVARGRGPASPRAGGMRLCCQAAPRTRSAGRVFKLRGTSSSGPGAACARCHARRSGSSRSSVASARARCTWRLSSADADRYAADRTSGCRNRIRVPNSASPASAAGAAASLPIPSPAAARRTSASSTEGSAAASSSNRRVFSGSALTRRRKFSSMLPDSGSAPGSPNPPASCAGVSPAQQLQQGERVAVRFGYDLIPYLRIDRPGQYGVQ